MPVYFFFFAKNPKKQQQQKNIEIRDRSKITITKHLIVPFCLSKEGNLENW